MNTLYKDSYDLVIAEDDDDDYLFFTIAIEEIAYSVKVSRAVDGEELMRLLLEHIPDILFLDIHMPCKDGHQCITEIRANHRYDNLPVIVYSSRDDGLMIDKCYRAGSNFFVSKPATLSEIKSILMRILDMSWKESMYYPTKDNFVLKPSWTKKTITKVEVLTRSAQERWKT